MREPVGSRMIETHQAAPLLRTPLYRFHVERGARIVPFAGYEMPVQYSAGIMTEHRHTRAAAGLFDVSHMGQIAVYPNSGRVEDAARAIEALVPIDVVGIAEGRQRYSLFTNTTGGILDDLMIANRGDHLMLIVNAACKIADLAHLRLHLESTCKITSLPDRALIALQGPSAEAVLSQLAPVVAAMRFMDVRSVQMVGSACEVSRLFYKRETGYEISIASDCVEQLVRALCSDKSVMPVGLGARDSLRLEAGLCLYGSDLDPTTTPVMASLEWAIQKVRRTGGARAGGFPGADIILWQLSGGVARRRIGLKAEDRTPARGGAKLYADDKSTETIGTVTSGGFGPSTQTPVAMGYVDRDAAVTGNLIFADVRGNRVALRVSDLPFVAHRYKRN